MLMSSLIGERLKEKPTDASAESHVFLLRGGYVRPVANGIYSLLPPAKRIITKIERIIRDEMDLVGGQEVLFPVVLPAELWKESGRFESVGDELVRFKDRTMHDMLLGITHEEAAVHLARTEAGSYLKYPFMMYQIQTKFRDEARSRGGLIRVREFTMKDAYSFHTSQGDLESHYEKMLAAYHRIFERVGLSQVVAVESDTGMMGGKTAHEFMLLCDAGEDTIVLCDSCSYRANMEAAITVLPKLEEEGQSLEEVSTPGVTDIEALCAFFGVPGSRFVKATVFAKAGSEKPLIVFIRGDLQVNEAKLCKEVGADVFPYTGTSGDGLCMGFLGPVGLSSSDFEIIYDQSLAGMKNMIGGANKKDTHLKGIDIVRDIGPETFCDVSKVREGDACPRCGKPLTLQKGIEVGHIFQLGDKYTRSMGMTYADAQGGRKIPLMGCYGIGIGRLMAGIIEARHDGFGPLWPASVTPWQIHICVLTGDNDEVRKTGFDLYETLSKRFEVLLDDRNMAAGVQFADADLLGIPLRLIVSARNLKNGEAEIVSRDKVLKKIVKLENVGFEMENINGQK